MATGGGSYYNQRSTQNYLNRPTAARLAPTAQARLDRFSSTASHTSLLSVPSAAGLHAVGLDPIGDVMGCIASHTGYSWIGRCGRRSATSPVRVVLNAKSAARGSYVGLLTSTYRTALSRLTDEARALGADGVVDIKLSRTVYGTVSEVVAVGTAVRARSSRHPDRPFTTDLPGTDVAKLMLSGWVPVSLHVVFELGIRHDDYATLGQASRMNQQNVEVAGFSELLQRTRTGAGALLRSRIAASGADGGLLSRFVTTNWSKECGLPMHSTDHVACTSAIGTSIARFGSARRATPKPLSIMPVSPRGGRP